MFSYLAKSYVIGLEECANPYSLALALFFVLFLILYGRSLKRLIFQCGGFLVILGLVYAFMYSGIVDHFILRKSLQKYFHFFYLSIGILYVIYAVLNFIDWFKLRFKEDVDVPLIVKIPAFYNLEEHSSKKKEKSLLKETGRGLAYVSFQFLALFFIAAQAIWPAGVSLYRLYVIFLSEGYDRFVYLFFGFYGLGELFLMILIWLFVLFLAKRNRGKTLTLKEKTLCKIFVSSLFLASGTGIIYYFFVNYLYQ